MIDAGRTGYLAPAGEANDLAARIVDLLDEDSLRATMGRAIQERVRHEFSFAMTSQKYIDLFQRVCASQAPG